MRKEEEEDKEMGWLLDGVEVSWRWLAEGERGLIGFADGDGVGIACLMFGVERKKTLVLKE